VTMASTELQQKDILEKDFETKLRGYDQQEVDEYLDIVIRDYKAFEQEIEEVKAENERLIERIDELSKQASTQTSTDGSSKLSTTYFDILKRISHLERHVFGSKLDDSDQE